jgi:DNA-binding IclR family transcriptional regulator
MRKCGHSSLTHGLAILDLLAHRLEWVPLGEIARELDLSKSGTHGLLATLVHCGRVERNGAGAYRLRESAARLGAGLSVRQLIDAADPVMRRLVTKVKDGAILGVLSGFEVVYIHRIESTEAVRVHAEVGDRIKAHCTSTGLALLAFQDEARRESSMPRHLPAYTPETITDRHNLAAELLRVRRRGYAVNRGGWRTEVGGIAVPLVPDPDPVAGLCVAVPRYRLTRDWISRSATALKDAAAELAATLRLGKQGPRPASAA